MKRVRPEPQLATLVDHVPNPGRWRYELKWDGYRLLAYCDGLNVLFLSRRGLDWTAEFPDVVAALRARSLRGCVLDGELCAISERGIPSFNLLQNRREGVRTVFVAFDLLLWLEKDLREEPIEERQAKLDELIGHDSSATVFASTPAEGDPQEILRLSCKAGYEGIIAKEKASRYTAGRSRTWLKVKCTKRQEFAVIGYVPMVGGKAVGALLLAVYEKSRFVYAGRTGTGFTSAQRSEFARLLDRDRMDRPPVDDPPRDVLAKAVWTKPRMVVEVAYLERTAGELRHSSFKGMRKDKRPTECVWEVTSPVARQDNPTPRS